MTERFAPPEVTIRRYPDSRICDVVVVVRGHEMVLRCPSYSQAVKWARLECKSYNIPEPATDFATFFASSARNLRRSGELKEKGK
jgi:hypothetical protein